MVTETKEKKVFAATKVPQGDLWHYTTIDVLEHFLEGEIAFSHYKFMNDDAELSYGRQFLIEVFDGLKNENMKEFLRGKIVDELVENAYLFCLSRDGDNLYQWRSYTPHGGIAVGFDRQKLYSSLHDGFSNAEWLPYVHRISGSLMQCHYRKELAERVIRKLNQRPTSCKCKGGVVSLCGGAFLLAAKILEILLSQKNPSFKEEHEERFLLTGVPREKVVVVNMKPRILVHNPGIAKSLSCVRLSPHGDRERNRLFVEILRDKYKLDFSIEQSCSSYNGR